MTIYINPTDEDKKAELEERTGASLTVSREDFIGGIRAVIHAKNILIDHSFKASLAEEYEKFLGVAGDELELLMHENQDVLKRLKERN